MGARAILEGTQYAPQRGTSAQSLSSPSYDLGAYMSAVQAANWQTNQFNAEQAAINRDWQEYMSSTAHTREMQDLKNAGLNPILAAQSGASTPSGGQASGSDASGAIAGLLGQMISAQTAQAVADRNNAAARLLSVMRYNQEVSLKEKFPESWAQLLNSFFSGFGMDASQVGFLVRTLLNYAIPEEDAKEALKFFKRK